MRGVSVSLVVISDSHQGLKDAIAVTRGGARWQRCRVHFMRDTRSHVPKACAMMVAATIRTVFAQPDATGAKEQWRRVADSFKGPLSPPVGSARSEQHDEWQVSKHCFSAESLAKVTGRLDTIPLPLAAAK